MLKHGRVDDVHRLLGRPYEVRGEVYRGDQRGRLLGFPTVNLLPPTMLPADGVYFGHATDASGNWFSAAINVGIRPTFAGHERRCEAHLLDADLPLGTYGWECAIRFEGFLRNEIRFEGVQAVKARSTVTSIESATFWRGPFWHHEHPIRDQRRTQCPCRPNPRRQSRCDHDPCQAGW